MRKTDVHDMTLLLLSLFYVAAVLVSESCLIDLMLVLFSLMNILLMRKVKWRGISIFFLVMLPACLSVFVSSALFSGTSPDGGSKILFRAAGIIVDDRAATLALFLTVRSFALAYISFVFVIHTDFEGVIRYAMQYLGLPLRIGYSLLAMTNAFAFMRGELYRIQDACRMRFLRRNLSPKIIVPLMVGAARYAFVAGLSMEIRGLNPKKTFVIKARRLSTSDFITLILNLFLLLAIFFSYQHDWP
ncbi:MAG: hypothetical protein HQK54_14195 [Oligoflexales bacterium]|nr:hypothetical protein [Oligoflexales bacterium]